MKLLPRKINQSINNKLEKRVNKFFVKKTFTPSPRVKFPLDMDSGEALAWDSLSATVEVNPKYNLKYLLRPKMFKRMLKHEKCHTAQDIHIYAYEKMMGLDTNIRDKQAIAFYEAHSPRVKMTPENIEIAKEYKAAEHNYPDYDLIEESVSGAVDRLFSHKNDNWWNRMLKNRLIAERTSEQYDEKAGANILEIEAVKAEFLA